MAGDSIEEIDEVNTNDHTYYGNGCPEGWGQGGSAISCSTRLLETLDNEYQENGVLYNFQSATSGTGGAMSTNNTNSPDTFCPLGWQLPYSGKGGDYYNKSRSWKFLFDVYNISFNDGDTASLTKFSSYPVSYVFSGYYYWGNGRIFQHGITGYWWSSNINNAGSSYFMRAWTPSTIKNGENYYKDYGSTVRCVLGFSILKLSMASAFTH